MLGLWLIVAPLTFSYGVGTVEPSGGRSVWLTLSQRIAAMTWSCSGQVKKNTSSIDGAMWTPWNASPSRWSLVMVLLPDGVRADDLAHPVVRAPLRFASAALLTGARPGRIPAARVTEG